MKINWQVTLSVVLCFCAFQACATVPAESRFDAAVAETRARLDIMLVAIPDVPLPADAGGGYTHEQHKRNYRTIYDAGMVYRHTGQKQYAEYAKDILLAYAAMYPELGDHPMKKEQSPGRLFWQSLNEAVWLVYTIQGYEAILPALNDSDKTAIENGVLRPMVSFLSEQSPQTFNKIHNHGTWAAAAVGMTGYVLNDKNYVQQALYGLEKDGNAGFMKQLDILFSPDGYYSEGPYYQRYALMPFLLFAKAIHHNDPEIKIFDYRDQILLKAIQACIQMSYAGYFFPINDAIKDKGLDTIELVYGVAIAYGLTSDPGYLSIAKLQDQLVLTDNGRLVANALDAGKEQPFKFTSVQLRDGPEGKQGALSILRHERNKRQQALVFKATAQGMGHGHFDRLNWLYYDGGHEIVTDYGAARFLNVEAKYGGHYLPENNTWAKQTIAHNTLVVDEKSQYQGDVSIADNLHTKTLLFDQQQDVQVTAAQVDGAYDGIRFIRSMFMINVEDLAQPLIVDVLKVVSKDKHRYDLPLHFNGHIMHINQAVKANVSSLPVAGKANGYQHLWVRANGTIGEGPLQLTWLNDKRFYTYSTLGSKNTGFMVTEIGANDPDFNLRQQLALIVRQEKASNHTFLSVLEPHGEYNGSKEYTTDSSSQIRNLALYQDGNNQVAKISLNNGREIAVAISYDTDAEKEHTFTAGSNTFQWRGYYQVTGHQEKSK